MLLIVLVVLLVLIGGCIFFMAGADPRRRSADEKNRLDMEQENALSAKRKKSDQETGEKPGL